jgi:O-antigen/teichoic acid export membrane protein
MSIAVKVFQGVLWRTASTWLQVLLDIVGVIILARWLGPENYGVMGAVLLVTGFVRMLSEGALLECLVQRDVLEPGHIDASFWSGMTAAILGMLLALLFATPLVALAGAPAAAELLPWAALLLPISAATAVPRMLQERELKFKEQSQMNLAVNIMSNMIGITAAISGLGLWSLLLMELTRAVGPHFFVWYSISWRPGLRCHQSHFRDLSGFNAKVIAAYLIGHLDRMLPRALIGHLLGPAALGIYLIAARIFDELGRLVTGPLAGVCMAVIARLQNDQPAVQRTIVGLYQASTIIGLPIFLGFIAIAPIAVPLLFGDRWMAAVPAIQILMLCAIRTTTAAFNIAILRALGQAGAPILLLAFGALLNIVLIPALAGFGVLGIMSALVLRQFLSWPLGCLLIRRVSDLSIIRQVSATLPAVAAAALMSVAVYLLGVALQDMAVAQIPVLVTAIVFGALFYLLALFVFAPKALVRIYRIVRSTFQRDERSLATQLGDPLKA